MKYLGITLIKYVQNLYNKNKKTSLREIKDDLNKWRNALFSLVRRLNIVEVPNFPRLHTIDLQIQFKPNQNLKRLSCRN